MSLLSLIGITDAYAATTAEPAQHGSSLFSLVFMLGGIILLFFLMMRPQMKRAKEHRALVAGISEGDEIITAGGILGRVTKLHDNFVEIQVANGVELRIQRNSVSQVLPKGTIESMQ